MIAPWMEEEYFGRPVASMQQMLRTLHFVDERVPALIPTGVFDAETEQGLRTFQQLAGLPVTGEADYDTWERLEEEFRRADRLLSPAMPMRVIFQCGSCIRPGERHVHLYPYQAALCALGTVLDVPKLEVTGVHDRRSVEATRWLQQRAELEESGMLDPQTWNALCCLYPAVMGDGSAAI